MSCSSHEGRKAPPPALAKLIISVFLADEERLAVKEYGSDNDLIATVRHNCLEASLGRVCQADIPAALLDSLNCSKLSTSIGKGQKHCLLLGCVA